MEGKSKSTPILLTIILILIFIIILGGWYFLSKDTNEQIATTENNNNAQRQNEIEIQYNNTIEDSTQLLTNKEIILTDRDKLALNKELTEYHLFLFMESSMSYRNAYGVFTDDDMAYLAAIYALGISRNVFTTTESSNLLIYSEEGFIDIDFLQIYVNKLFNRKINTANLSFEISNNKVKVPLPTGMGIYSYKVDKLLLDETTNTYSLYVDDTSKETAEYSNYLEFWNVATYDKSKVTSSYILKYGEINGSKYFISLDKI